MRLWSLYNIFISIYKKPNNSDSYLPVTDSSDFRRKVLPVCEGEGLTLAEIAQRLNGGKAHERAVRLHVAQNAIFHSLKKHPATYKVAQRGFAN